MIDKKKRKTRIEGDRPERTIPAAAGTTGSGSRTRAVGLRSRPTRRGLHVPDAVGRTLQAILASAPFELAGEVLIAGSRRPAPTLLHCARIVMRNGRLEQGETRILELAAIEDAVRDGSASLILKRTA